MKKIITFSVLIMTLVFAPFSIGFAQELTRNDLKVLAPNLLQVVSSLNVLVQNEISRMNAERAALMSLTPLLNSVAYQINQPGYNPTQNQIDALGRQLDSVENVVTSITSRRQAFQNALNPIINILNDIARDIASAKS
jgi:hypothetical protein